MWSRLKNFFKKLFVRKVKPQPDKVHNLKWESAPWMRLAYNEIGQKEIVGGVHNRRIIEYHSATDLAATNDETAWCSAFVNYVLSISGYKTTNSALARSWIQRVNHDITVNSDLKFGAICVFKRGNSSWQGHVGFCVKHDSKYVWVLGGNQNNEVCIIKYSCKQLIGTRWPRPS